MKKTHYDTMVGYKSVENKRDDGGGEVYQLSGYLSDGLDVLLL